MKFSAKSRYATAALIFMAQSQSAGENITVATVSNQLGISKIYLEQTFSLLRRSGIVNSVKGAQGGYQLAKHPHDITVYDIISAIDPALIETSEETVGDFSPAIESAMRTIFFSPVNEKFISSLRAVSLSNMADEAQRHSEADGYMYYL